MKLYIYFSILFLGLSSCSKSEFEGEIHYQTGKIVIFNKELDEDRVMAFFGNTTVTSFKPGGFYRDESDAKKYAVQLWRAEDTAVYYLSSATADTALRFKTNTEKRKKFLKKVEENACTILGYECDMLEVITDRGLKRYYYSKDLPLDPKVYAGFTNSNKDKIMELMPYAYLKIELENKDFKIDFTATKIVEKAVDSSVFELPKGITVIDKRRWY